MNVHWVIPNPHRGQRGKRACRQAFYSRLRTARLLKRVVRGLPGISDAFERAWLDAAYHGTGVLEVSTAGVRRADPRTMYFGFDGQEMPPPDGGPRDGEIAGLQRIFTVGADTPFAREIFGEDDAGRVRVVDTYSRPS